MSDITIRPSKESDYEAVRDLYILEYSQYHKEYPHAYKKVTKSILTRGNWLTMIEEKKEITMVALDGDKVVGHIYAYPDDVEDNEVSKKSHRLEIGQVAVAKGHQRKKIATRLIREIMEYAAKKKYDEVAALVYAFNDPSIKLFESAGLTQYSIKYTKRLKP